MHYRGGSLVSERYAFSEAHLLLVKAVIDV